MAKMTNRRERVGHLSDTVHRLKKELQDSYSMMKNSLDPVRNADFFNSRRAVLNELIENLKLFGESSVGGEEAEIEGIKEKIRAEVLEIAVLNSAFSDLIKKNIHYNSLTISFITDAFNRTSIYDRAGSNNSNFLPLKNVLMNSGVKI